MLAAATVLTASERCLKKSLFHAPIIKTFQPNHPSARLRPSLGAARNKRYPAVARAPSIPSQATGMTQSFGLKNGFFSVLYQKKMSGWFGEGLLEALIARGNTIALEAMTAEPTRDGRCSVAGMALMTRKLIVNLFCTMRAPNDKCRRNPPSAGSAADPADGEEHRRGAEDRHHGRPRTRVAMIAFRHEVAGSNVKKKSGE